MRLSLIAMVLALAAIVGTASAEANPYYGDNNDGRIERSHSNWTGKRRYSNRQHSQRRYSNHRSSHRQYAQRTGAHRGYSNRRYAHRGYSHRNAYRQGAQRQYAQRRHYGRRTYASSGRSVGGRPGAWCGWWMRTQLGGGPEYNLAANWRRYGRSSGPQVGAVVVWPHHVGIITGRASNGRWIVKSGNDGNRVRERARSVSGAVFRVG
jgi:hypothetical protein